MARQSDDHDAPSRREPARRAHPRVLPVSRPADPPRGAHDVARHARGPARRESAARQRRCSTSKASRSSYRPCKPSCTSPSCSTRGPPTIAARGSFSSRATWTREEIERTFDAFDFAPAVTEKAAIDPAAYAQFVEAMKGFRKAQLKRAVEEASGDQNRRTSKSQEFLSDADQGPLKVIKGATLIDGRGGAPLKDPVIVIQGRHIKSVGDRATERRCRRDAEVIDAEGCTLMPGMMDLHIHTAMFNCMTFHNHRVAQFEIMPHLQQMYALFHAQNCFDMGFTTLRDLGMNGPRGLAGRRDVRRARRDQRRHRRRPAHADRRFHDDDRLASRSHPAARDVSLGVSTPRTVRGSCASSRARTCSRAPTSSRPALRAAAAPTRKSPTSAT